MTDNLSDILPLTSNTVRLFSLPPSPFERSCICRNSTRCWALIAMSRETQPSGLTRVTLASTSDNQVNSFRGDWPWQHGDLVIGSIWSNWFIWLVGFKLSAGVLRASLQALGRERERERGGGKQRISWMFWFVNREFNYYCVNSLTLTGDCRWMACSRIEWIPFGNYWSIADRCWIIF